MKLRGRKATREERDAARVGLADLGERRLRIALVPAPRPKHASHKVRVVAETNPGWYQTFAAPLLERGARPRRKRIARTLALVADRGYVQPHPWSSAARLLELLVDDVNDRRMRGEW